MKQAGPRSWRRPGTSTLVSIAVHLVLGVVLWQAVQMPAVYERFLRLTRREQAPPLPERVQFVTVAPDEPPPVAGSPTARERRPDEAVRTEPVVPLVAPAQVPDRLPPVPPTPVPERATGAAAPGSGATGPLRGGSGPTRGVQPGYEDPRVWKADPEFIYAPKTDKERLDSALVTTLNRYIDSLAAFGYKPNKFERGDWTIGSEGNKWGIDQQYIRLGRFSIPTALLALLPLNRMQANPIAMERERNAAWMRADILYHAQAAMNEEQFRQAVRSIRDRKERERRQASRVPPTNPGPISSPGERPPPG